jgi:hypothetical protein
LCGDCATIALRFQSNRYATSRHFRCVSKAIAERLDTDCAAFAKRLRSDFEVNGQLLLTIDCAAIAVRSDRAATAQRLYNDCAAFAQGLRSDCVAMLRSDSEAMLKRFRSDVRAIGQRCCEAIPKRFQSDFKAISKRFQSDCAVIPKRF